MHVRATILAVHEGLGVWGRLPPIGRTGGRISAVQIATLVAVGIAMAAVSVFMPRGLQLPGHNIICVIFPMALGLAAVPRKGAASVMGLSGLAGAVMLSGVGPRGIGVGAVTGLVLIGLLLDLALLGARSGRSIYWRLAMAGLAANTVAMLARGGAKMLEGSHTLTLWLPKALVSYPLCGILAGLISAAVWFRVTADKEPRSIDGAAE